jgi:drug/metabolite transporter (DMT)-like permease
MKQNKHFYNPRLTITALLLSYAIWGLNTPIIKLGIEDFSPAIFMSIKVLGASLLILPLAIKHWVPINRKTFLILALSGIIWVSFGSFSQYLGLRLAPSINSALITLLGPLILFLLSVEYLNEKFSSRKLIGTIMAFLGALIIIGEPLINGGFDSKILLGNFLFLLAVSGHVVGAVIAKPQLNKVSSYQATFIHLAVGGLPVVIYALTQAGDISVESFSNKTIYALIYGVLAVTIASFLFNYVLKRKKTQEIGVYAYTEPLVTIIAASVLLGEYPDMRFVVGALLVFVGIYVVEAKLPYRLHLHYGHHHH